jgi:WD40 repeat protein
MWKLATGEMLRQLPIGPVNTLVLSRDGRHLFAFQSLGGLSGMAVGWLLAGDLSRVVRLDHDAGLNGATFSPDHVELATLSQDGTVRIWSVDGVLKATLHHAGPVGVAAWSPDGSWLATGTNAGALTIWNRSTWRPRKVIEAHVNFMTALAIDDRGTLIASAGGDGMVKLWDVESLLQVGRIPTGNTVESLAFEGDRLLVSGPLSTQAWRSNLYTW